MFKNLNMPSMKKKIIAIISLRYILLWCMKTIEQKQQQKFRMKKIKNFIHNIFIIYIFFVKYFHCSFNQGKILSIIAATAPKQYLRKKSTIKMNNLKIRFVCAFVAKLRWLNKICKKKFHFLRKFRERISISLSVLRS